MLKSALTIATSVFLLMSGAADLFAMEPEDDLDGNRGKQLVIATTVDAEPASINHLPKDNMQVLFLETSKCTNPRHLASVCKYWFNVIRENNLPQEKLSYSTMNPFMQLCMHTYWENLLYNGILQYTPTDASDTATLKFSDFNKDGIFDLSKCGNSGQNLIITESMNHFFKVGEENKDKTVIGIMLRHRIQQEIKNSPDHPFTSLMKDWEADKAPVGLFWRRGDDKNLYWFDYLTTASLREVSSRKLYENWQVGCRHGRGAVLGRLRADECRLVFMFVFELK